MNAVPLLLASAPDVVLSFLRSLGQSTGEMTLIIGAAIAVVFPVVIWAAFIRRPPRDRERPYGQHHSSEHHRDAAPEQAGPSSERRRRRRWRRRRREHRPRNPTLAETGGLPPVRSEQPPGTAS